MVEKLLMLLFVSIITLISFLFMDYAMGERQEIDVTVIEKIYQSGSVSTGLDTNGNMITTSSPERYKLIVEDQTGEVFSITVSSNDYRDANTNDIITIPVVYGNWTGSMYK